MLAGKPPGMSGSVYFAIIGFVMLVVLTLVLSPLFLIPAVVILLFLVMTTPLLALLGGRGRASGTPTTSEAAYDPVVQPEQRDPV